MTLNLQLFNAMYSHQNWAHLTAGYETILKLWRTMSPELLLDFRNADSQISYEDSLATYGAGLLVMGNFRRAYEVRPT